MVAVAFFLQEQVNATKPTKESNLSIAKNTTNKKELLLAAPLAIVPQNLSVSASSEYVVEDSSMFYVFYFLRGIASADGFECFAVGGDR